MNLWLWVLVLAVSVAGAIAVLSLVRRRAPDGGFFTDSDRAAGVFGVVGTSFAVLLAFVIFVAFQSYSSAKDKAGQEAIAVTELYHTSELFPANARADLAGETICYARAVVEDEWPKMRHERRSALVEGWIDRFDASLARLNLTGASQPVAFGHWLEQSSSRREGRRGRLAEASPFVPGPLWFALFVGAVLLVAFACLFGDRRERFPIQATMVGAIAAIVVAGLLVIRFLDHPYENRAGSIKPVEMRHTLELMQSRQGVIPVDPPCDNDGRPS